MSTLCHTLHSQPKKATLFAPDRELLSLPSYPACERACAQNQALFPAPCLRVPGRGADNLAILQWMRGVSGIVSCGGTPSQIPDNSIAAIRRRADKFNTIRTGRLDGWKRGDLFTTQDGSFRDYEAIFDTHISGEERVRVLFSHLSGRQTPLELPARQIQ